MLVNQHRNSTAKVECDRENSTTQSQDLEGSVVPSSYAWPNFVIAFSYLAQSGQIDHPRAHNSIDLFIFFVVTAGQDWLYLARSERHYSIRNLAIVESPPGDDSLVVNCPS